MAVSYTHLDVYKRQASARVLYSSSPTLATAVSAASTVTLLVSPPTTCLFYTSELHGEGRPLLLLNGIMMSCGSWAEFVEPLSAQNQLILLDMLDQGRSAKMTEAYDHGIQIRLVDALLDHQMCIRDRYGTRHGRLR